MLMKLMKENTQEEYKMNVSLHASSIFLQHPLETNYLRLF